MIISNSRKFVYVRSQKTASVSIQSVLVKICSPEDTVYLSTRLRGSGIAAELSEHVKVEFTDFSGDHASLQFILKNFPHTSPYFFISSIRNPFDVEVSRFNYRHDHQKKSFSKALRQYLSIPRYDQNQYYFHPEKAIDFFLRVEELQNDVDSLWELMGWGQPPEVPKLNPSFGVDVKWTRRQVASMMKKYSRLVELGGYRTPVVLPRGRFIPK